MQVAILTYIPEVVFVESLALFEGLSESFAPLLSMDFRRGIRMVSRRWRAHSAVGNVVTIYRQDQTGQQPN